MPKQGAPPGARDEAEFAVLVIEDDAKTAQSIAKIAEVFGRVVVVGTVADALRAVHDGAPWGAILIDVVLPDGTGVEVLVEAKKRTPLLAAAFCSSWFFQNAADAAYDLDAYYVIKEAGWEARVEKFLWLARARTLASPDKVLATLQEWDARFRLGPVLSFILGLGAEGRSRDEIAKVRARSVWTVRDQEDRIAEKTGHKKFAQAVRALLFEAAQRPARPRR